MCCGRGGRYLLSLSCIYLYGEGTVTSYTFTLEYIRTSMCMFPLYICGAKIVHAALHVLIRPLEHILVLLFFFLVLSLQISAQTTWTACSPSFRSATARLPINESESCVTTLKSGAGKPKHSYPFGFVQATDRRLGHYVSWKRSHRADWEHMSNMSLMFLAPVWLCTALVFDATARRCDKPKWCIHWSVSFSTLPLHATATTNHNTVAVYSCPGVTAEILCLSLHQFSARVRVGLRVSGWDSLASPPPAALTRKAFALISVKQGKQRRCGKGLPKWDQVRDRGVGGCHFHPQLLHIQQGEQGRAGVARSTCIMKSNGSIGDKR